jgi:prophage antirepressor-like protein
MAAILKTFVFGDSSHEVQILKENGQILFRASDVGRVLGLSQVTSSIRNFNEEEKVLQLMHTLGGAQNVTFLTKRGVYRLVMKSDKPAALPFQDWILSVIESIEETGRYDINEKATSVIAVKEQELADLKASTANADDTIADLRRQLEEDRSQKLEAMKKASAFETALDDVKNRAELDRHKMFIAAHESCSLVYLGKLGTIGEENLVKIGSTKNLKSRAASLKQDYGTFTVFEVFLVSRNQDFERFLQHKFAKYRHNDAVGTKGRKSTEVFKLTDDLISKLVMTGKRNATRFIKGKIDVISDKLDVMAGAMGIEFPDSDEDDVILEEELDDSKPVTAAPPSSDEVIHKNKRGISTNSNGSKIQRYSEDGAELLETYGQMNKAVRDSKMPEGMRSGGIREAIIHNRPYKGFRWAYLDRSLPNDTVQELEMERATKKPKNGFVAELDSSKSVVLNVYADRTAASTSLGYKFVSSLIKRMVAGKECGDDGHYFVAWDELDDALKNTYEGEMPRSGKIGKKVEQLDRDTGEVVETYQYQDDVLKKFVISRKTLAAAIAGGLVEKGFKWRFA